MGTFKGGRGISQYQRYSCLFPHLRSLYFKQGQDGCLFKHKINDVQQANKRGWFEKRQVLLTISSWHLYKCQNHFSHSIDCMELFVDIFLPSLKPNQILPQKRQKKNKKKKDENKKKKNHATWGNCPSNIEKKLPSQNLGYLHLTRQICTCSAGRV